MSTPDRITKMIPRARPVMLAGKSYPIFEFRLQDLATLQGWLDDEWPDPLDAIEEQLLKGDLGDKERDDLLFDAWLAAEQGPPADGTPEAMKKLATMAGTCAFLLCALSRNRPKDAPYEQAEIEEIVRIAPQVTRAEYRKLQRVCFGASSLKVLTRMIMGYEPSGDDAITWSEAIDAVARSYGWTYEYIYSLTITEFVSARRQGKPIDEAYSETYRPDQAQRYADYVARKYGGVN